MNEWQSLAKVNFCLICREIFDDKYLEEHEHSKKQHKLKITNINEQTKTITLDSEAE